MSDPFIGEIRPFAFSYAPVNWAFCDGQIVDISQNTTLFSLLGTNFGGNGTTNFALPNLQGRVAIKAGQGPGLTYRGLGDMGGNSEVALSASQIPSHTHTVNSENDSDPGNQASPSGHFIGTNDSTKLYKEAPTSTVDMNAGFVKSTGGQAHYNMQPYLVMNYCIAMEGFYPPRT